MIESGQAKWIFSLNIEQLFWFFKGENGGCNGSPGLASPDVLLDLAPYSGYTFKYETN